MDPFEIHVDDEAVELRSRLASANTEILTLRDQVDRRTQLLDDLRSAYMRDVVVMKDRLWKHGITSDADLAALPTADLKPFLPLFSPASHFLDVRPCSACGGGVHLVRRDDDVLAQALVDAQLAKQRLTASQSVQASLEVSLSTALADAATMQRLVFKEKKLNASLVNEKEKLQSQLASIQSRSWHIGVLEASVQDLQATISRVEEEKAAVTRWLDQTRLDLVDADQRHAVAIAAAAQSMEELRRESQLHLQSVQDELVQAHTTMEALRAEIQALHESKDALETRLRAEHLGELNALTTSWRREMDGTALERNVAGMVLADVQGRWSQTSARLLAAHDRINAMTSEKRALLRARDAADARKTELAQELAASSQRVERIQREMATQVESTARTLQLKLLWLWMKAQARETTWSAWCQFLKAAWRLVKVEKTERVGQLVGGTYVQLSTDGATTLAHLEKHEAIQHLERSLVQADERRRDLQDHVRGLQAKLERVNEALTQRTREYTIASRALAAAECTKIQLQSAVDTMKEAADDEKEARCRAEMAQHDAWTRFLSIFQALEQCFSDDMAVMHAKLQDLQAKAALLEEEKADAKTLLVQCQERLAATVELLENKKFECMAFQNDLADVADEMVSLERKLAGEHRRAAMYEEMVANMTKVIHDQQTTIESLEIRLDRRNERQASIDLDWMLRNTAATTIQMAWRHARACRLHRYKRGIQQRQVEHVITSTATAQRNSAQGLQFVRATTELARFLSQLGVDTSFLCPSSTAFDKKLAGVKGNTAAACLQNAWRMYAKRKIVASRLALSGLQARHRRLVKSLHALDLTRRHYQQLRALGVKFEPAKVLPPKRTPPVRPKSAIPGLLKYRLQHPIKSTNNQD
ncbi:unnamed protein product [Aphanomyces euteiches]|uniref:Uncharacterized protein n=1 Tax=Aphanomyces euteiches TaxID=100861 RepID=A0A6G0XTP4_9STRA|nr:hypothetical protein Ae201684_001624 [Aphanomyces euteiches]KAH9075312.1 hypothetical protein Ae201684P_003993 [Aphanomyces euteiches]KAH9137459.1 hypothetical protein AeRB84_017850 [Aphanomyces euteiches]